MEYTEYITKEGDRWDLIAYRAYGDALKMEPILLANTDVPVTGVLPIGTVIYVPVLEDSEVNTDNLPPWKK